MLPPPGCVATTNVDVGALKVRAEQNRTRRRGRTGQEPFRAPKIRIMPINQPFAFLLALVPPSSPRLSFV